MNNTMKKKLIRLTESDLHTLIKEAVRKAMDIPTFRTGRRKYYVDDMPEEMGVAAGDDEDGYRTRITPDDYYNLTDYDEGFGYHYVPGNEEPICYDNVEGACYDSGEYEDNDTDMKLSYAKYAHNQSNTPASVRRYQMDRDFRDMNKRKNHAGKYDGQVCRFFGDYADDNLNVSDNKGSYAMAALGNDKLRRRYARNLTSNTPKGIDNAIARTKPLLKKNEKTK